MTSAAPEVLTAALVLCGRCAAPLGVGYGDRRLEVGAAVIRETTDLFCLRCNYRTRWPERGAPARVAGGAGPHINADGPG